MKLADLIQRQLIKVPLGARTKSESLEELAALVSTNLNTSQREIIHALDERERQGQFSMGKQLAFPHARTDSVKEFTIAIGVCSQGIDFHAPDGLPVKLIILFVIPKKHSNLYLEALASFLNFFSVEQNFNRALQAQNVDEFIRIFETTEENSLLSLIKSDSPRLFLNSNLRDALALMAKSNTNVLPVLDDKGRIVFELKLEGKLQDPVYFKDNAAKLITDLGVEKNMPTNYLEYPPSKDDLKRLFSNNAKVAYVTKDKKLIGTITAIEFLNYEIL